MLEAAALAGPSILAVGVAGLLVLYRRPTTRPVTRSGYTVMAFVVAFLTVTGILGALALPSKVLSSVTEDAMSSVVEGYYVKRVQSLESPGLPEILDMLRAAYNESASLAAGGLASSRCTLEARPYAAALALVSVGAASLEIAIVADPFIPSGEAYLVVAAVANASSLPLEARGLEIHVIREASDLPDKWLGALCGPSGCPGGVPVEWGAGRNEWYTLYPLAALLVVNPGDLPRLQGVEALAVDRAWVYSLVVTDIPDGCYSEVSPRALTFFARSTLAEAAPPGYMAYVSQRVFDRAGVLESIQSLSDGGAALSLAVLVSMVFAVASPLASAGAASLSRSVAVLRLRGLGLPGLKRILVALTFSSLAAGIGAGLVAGLAVMGPYTRYTSVWGEAAAAGVAVIALLAMYRRALRESRRVWVEAVARGHPLAAAPPSPPEGLGRAGWALLVLGVYHAVRGYLGFTTIELAEKHGEWLSRAPPALQVLVAIWAIVELLTAPFAPAFLAYASARLIAWKSRSIISSRPVSAVMGEAAPAARGLAGVIAGRAMALVILAVFAASLVGAASLSSTAADSWAKASAASAISPGLLAVKALEPQKVEGDLAVYNVDAALQDASRACIEGVIVVALPAYTPGPPLGTGAPSSVLVIYTSNDGAEKLYDAAGIPLDRRARRALENPGMGLIPGSPGSEYYSSSARLEVPTPGGGSVMVLLNTSLVGVEAIPGLGVLRYYTNTSPLGGPGMLEAVAAGEWALRILPGEVAYPRASGAAPVVAVYTLRSDAPCRASLEAAGFHVYTRGDIEASPQFRLYASILARAHPASFLVPTALTASALSMLAAFLLAADANREVRPFMALLRLRGAGPREGLRISLALWGSLVALAVLVGMAAGVGVAEGAIGIVTGMAGNLRVPVTVTLPGGPSVTAVFSPGTAGRLAYGAEAILYPALLGAALMAPLVYVSLRVFRGVIVEWLRL